MENKKEKVEQVLLEMISALENNDEALYLELLSVLKKIENENNDEDQTD